MNEAFVKSVKRLLLLVVLYIATLIIGTILGSVFDNIEITKWTMVIGFMLIAGWLYWRTDSIIPGLIIHIANNSLTAIDLSHQTDTFYLIAIVGGLLLLAYGLWWFWKNVKKCENF